MPKKVVGNSTPSDVVSVNDLDVSRLYGIQHGKNASKRYKLHIRADGGKVEAIGFLNSTGHLNESSKFRDLNAAYDYCQRKGHTMLQFDNTSDFATWLGS